MQNRIEEKKETNIPLETNGVFEVDKEDTKKGVEDTLKIGKIIISEEEIEEILKENKVTQRIVLLRHYPYNEEIEEDRKIIKEYNDLLSKKFRGETVDNERLSYLEKIVDNLSYKTYDEIKDKRTKQIIKILFLEKDKLLFLYSNTGKQRVRNTGEDLIKVFSLNNIDYINLKGSDKSLPLGYIYIDMSSYFKDEYVKIKNNEENKKYETIVIVGNRTYSYGMNFISGDGDVTIRESEKDFEKEGYIFHEYNESGKILRNTGNIIVTPKNYENFKKIFDLEHTSIIDFQNKLNVYLIKNPELTKKYVKSEIEELRKYCLVKLIETKELESLNEIFLDETFRKSINLKDYERLDKKYYVVLRYYVKNYPKILEIRSKSLDLRIKKGEDIEPDFNFDKAEYNDVLELINRGKPIKYIEGKAGAGKSFLLSYIAEKLNEENLNNNKLQKLYYLVYINLSGKGLEEINEVGSEIYNDYEVVYLIDSIDESKIYGEERKELDKKLLSLSKKGKVIITSRNGYQEKYDDEDNQEKIQKELLKNNQEIIELQDFTKENIHEYLEKYFGENTLNITKTKVILEKINGAGNNPLILCMICEVVEKGGLKNEEGEIIPLEKITIIDIYNNIVELRLLEGNSIDKNRKLENMLENSEIIDLRLKFLNKLGYKMLFGNTFTKKEDLIKIIKDMKLSGGFHKDLESLNLLFREGEDGEYYFVHQSFKEYFAAKYIFEEMKNNPEFDYEDFLCQGLKKVDINFLEIFVEFIKIDEKIKEKLLEQINENESYFPQCIHHKIVFLLGNLKIKQVKGLLQNYYIDSDMYNILQKYNITNLLSDNNNGISEDVKISYIIYSSKGLDTIEQVRNLYIRFRKMLNFNGYNICLLEELIKNINIKIGTDDNKLFFILTNLFLLFDSNYNINYRLFLLKKISLLNSELKEDFFNKILNNENNIQIKIKILKIKQNIFGINIDSKLKEIFNNTKKINIKLECIYVRPNLITENELNKIFFPYISYSNINFGYYNKDVSRLIKFRRKLIGILEYFLNEENYITFLLNELNNSYYDEVKSLCSYLLYNFFKKKTKEELLIIFNGTDNFFVKRSIVENLGYKSFDIETLTPILEFSLDKGIYNFENFIGYITDSEREKIYIEISQYSEKLRNTFGLYGIGKTFKEEFDENIKYIYNVIEKKYDFTLIRDIIYGFSIYGGKKAINFLRHLFLNNKQNDLKRYCIFCLKQIGGRTNLKFIEQHKDFFEEE